MFLPNSHMQYLVKSSSHSSSSNTSVFPSGKANQSLTPVSPASRSPFCHLSLLPGFLSGRSQFHQSPARSALSQVAPSSCTLCESNASHCKRRNDMLLFLATCSEHLMLEKYNFTCIYLVGKSMLRCSSDSRRTVQSPRSLKQRRTLCGAEVGSGTCMLESHRSHKEVEHALFTKCMFAFGRSVQFPRSRAS